MNPVLIDEVCTIAGALRFAAWSLAIFGLSKALFGSFPWLEVMTRIHGRGTAKRNRLQEVRWSLQHNERFSVARAKGDDMAAKQPLVAAERQALEEEWNRLVQSSVWYRGFVYFGDCMFCQAFWPALALLVAARGLAWAVPFSALAYAVAATALSRVIHVGGRPAPAHSKSGGCKSCGG
jgi:hypothetical protein